MTGARISRLRWLAGGIAVAVLGLLALQAVEAERSAGRAVGILLGEAPRGLELDDVTPGGPADRAGLRPGDVLLEINGRPVPTFEAYDRAVNDFERGEGAVYRFRRDGREQQRLVRPGMPFPWTDFGFNFPTALAHLALGLVAFSQRPRDIRARLLALLSFAVAIELSLPISLVGAPELLLVVDCLFILLSGLQMGLELHLASVIPAPRPWLRRRGWLAPLYYLLGLGFAFPALAAYLAELLELGSLPWTYEQGMFVLLSVGLPAWAIAVLALLGSAALRHPEARGRHQAGLVFIGTLPWAALVIATLTVEVMGLPITEWVVHVETLTLLCYPVATFIAIFRYHLFDLELVVRRSLVYGILTASLLLVFYGAVGIGGALLSDRAGGAGSVWAVAAATLLMGLLFSPLKAGVQRLIDRHFFRERAAVRQELVRLASRLPSLGNLPSMGRELVSRLCEVLGIQSASLLLADPESELLSTLASRFPSWEDTSQQFLLSPDDPGIELLRQVRRPLKSHQLKSSSRRLVERLDLFDVALLVPVMRNGDLVGLLLLGAKESGEDYASEEIELLSLLSHHVATVFENARLFESATRDSLTGLLRRESVLEELSREVRRAFRFERPLTIAMADLDHFKEINDRHGHLAGDLMLKRVARVLKQGLRSTDIVGRYGGEEFLIVLPETDLSGAIQGAHKVRRLLADLEVRLDSGETVTATVSVGLASLDEFPLGSLPSADALIAAADARLYLAKNSGRNRVEPADADRPGRAAARRAAQAARFRAPQ